VLPHQRENVSLFAQSSQNDLSRSDKSTLVHMRKHYETGQHGSKHSLVQLRNQRTTHFVETRGLTRGSAFSL